MGSELFVGTGGGREEEQELLVGTGGGRDEGLAGIVPKFKLTTSSSTGGCSASTKFSREVVLCPNRLYFARIGINDLN